MMHEVQPIFYPDGTVFVPLSKTKFKGLYAKIDFEDFAKVNQLNWSASWQEHRKSYCAVNTNPSQSMHRLIMGLESGNIDKRQVDHKNHDTLDNRKSNLRITSNRGNQLNRRDSRTTPGLYYQSKTKKWVARIQINGKRVRLGNFVSIAEAAAAYNKACGNI